MTEDVFLDFREEIKIKTGGMLPHWNQVGKIQFVTFRLADSLPQSQLRLLSRFTENFKKAHPEDPWPPEVKREFRTLVSQHEERLLDKGYGSCVLKLTKCQSILLQAIRFYEISQYRVIASVIMPNHVHLLLWMTGDKDLDSLIHGIKLYSARRINAATGKIGTVWQKEYYDRLVRNMQHFLNCLEYIKNNPKHIPQGAYMLYINEPLIQQIEANSR